ncbi:MAG TPA: hypothetical protein PK014_12200 [Thermoanaerobaculia bacterium]|nr:hypothetical protein [Thermoanaerobaculia bacterium]HUM30827.1 hypothetical protein [Thermoanaerobaculia bacterium]HXK69162.1 hypothetical protein [Thermoanaerobaculia bacterium]
MHKRHMIGCLVLVLAVLVSPQAFGQSTTMDLEIGYQVVDVTGNEDMYRTQLNQDDGFVIRDFSLRVLNPEGTKLFDRLTIDASGFGGNPYGHLRLDTGLGDTYRLHLNFNRFESFSALPAYANPFLENGIVPGQHTWERDRETISFEVELMPGKKFSPIFGYIRNQYDGPRQTTFYEGQDEFRLRSDLEETEEEYYVGVNFALGKFAGTLIQGWRSFEGTEHAELAAGAGSGNNDYVYLGVDPTATSISRVSRTEVDTPVTTFRLTGPLGDRVRMKASYVRADAESDTVLADMLSGSLVSYRIYRFFEGLTDTVVSNTDNPSWRGDLSFAVDLGEKVSLDLGYTSRHRELTGWSLVSSLYLDTMTFGGIDTGDILTLAEMNNSMERDDDVLDLRLNFGKVGIFRFWAGGSITSTDLDLTEDVAEIVVQTHQSGQFDREVSKYFFGTSADLGKGKFMVDWQTESTDDIIVRTNFTDRDRLRFRLQMPFLKYFEVLGTVETISSDNSSTDVGYEADTDHYAVDLGITPSDFLSFHLTWDSYETESTIPFRDPYTFDLSTSLFNDEGTLLEGSVDLHSGRFGLRAGYSTFENDGSLLLEFDRIFARCTLELSSQISAALEVETYDYSEDFLSAADFESERYGLFFRFHY